MKPWKINRFLEVTSRDSGESLGHVLSGWPMHGGWVASGPDGHPVGKEFRKQADAARALYEYATKPFPEDGSVEIRFADLIGQKEPELDEVICRDVKLLHVEAMDDNHWWVGVDLADGRILHLNFHTKRAHISLSVQGPIYK